MIKNLDLFESAQLAKNFAHLVDGLIALNEYHRDVLPMGVRETMSPAHYASEFCTIAVDVGRRIGKTQYIKDHANAESLIVVANQAQRDDLDRAFSKNNVHPTIVTASMLDHNEFRSRKNYNSFAKIYVDEPKLVYRYIHHDDLYLACTHKQQPYSQTFILLGS